MPKLIHFDIMLNGRFVATEHIPITRDMIIVETVGGGKTEEYIDMDVVCAKMLYKRPSLKNQPYKICF